MNILALDLGTKTGWAIRYAGAVESGVQVFDVKRGESSGMRYIRFNRWLEMTLRPDISPKTPTLLVYEQTHQRGGAATEVAAGFATRVQEFAARHGYEHAAVHSGTLKKFATGKGNAGKPEMIAAAREKWPDVEIIDDNHADALWLLEYARVEIVGAEMVAGAKEG